MQRRRLILSTAAAVLAVTALAYVAAGMRFYQSYQAAYANYRVTTAEPCHALIVWSPPTTIYTGLYLNQPSLVTLRYRSPQPQTLRITVSVPTLTQEQTITVQAAPAFQEQAFKPILLPGDPLTGPDERPADLHLVVSGNDGPPCETTKSVVVKSYRWMHWRDPATGDNTRYLAGWVTPEEQSVNAFVARAAELLAEHPADYDGLSRLHGYTGATTPDDVRNQVNVLFDTLASVYQVHYAEDNIPFTSDAEQRIQLPRDVLTAPQRAAMCVETTAILASAVEHLGMRPYFILIPGHVFLGVALGKDLSAPLAYWETSDLNGVTGNQANLHGDSEYTAHQADAQAVDVQYWRQHGILPIE
ncbi:MAG: hypothetical protein ACXWQ8_18860 [Ktedonobacterales bacterium]